MEISAARVVMASGMRSGGTGGSGSGIYLTGSDFNDLINNTVYGNYGGAGGNRF